jgi:hypothetical protein
MLEARKQKLGYNKKKKDDDDSDSDGKSNESDGGWYDSD